MVSTTINRVKTSVQQSPIDAFFLLALAIALLPGLGFALLDLIPIPAQLDFATYYLAAQALNIGQSPYDRVALDALAQQAGGIPHAAYFYPPAFAAVLRPLALLPFPVANTFWFLLNVGWYVVGATLLARLLALPSRWYLPLLSASFLVPALHHTLELGQLNTIFFALIAGSLVMLTAGRRGGVGGGLLGLLGAVKLFPLVLALPLLPHRRWRAVAGLSVALVGTAAVGIVAGGGLAASRIWLTDILPSIVGGFASPNNQSVLAAAVRLGTPTEVEPLTLFGAPPRMQLLPLVNAPLLFRGVGLLLCAVIGAVTIALLTREWRQRTKTSNLPREMSALLACTLLITPIVWYHYYVLLLIPIGVGLREGWQDVSVRRLILVGCLLLAVQRYWRIIVLLGTPLLLSLGTLGTLAIWWALLRLLGHDSRQEAEE